MFQDSEELTDRRAQMSSEDIKRSQRSNRIFAGVGEQGNMVMRPSGALARPGFSILELLLVLVILSILAGIVGVRFAGQSTKAQIDAARAQMSEFRTALGVYEIQTGTYPTTEQGLDALAERPAGMDADRWPGPLLERVPLDQWGNSWQYRYPGQHNTNSYDLWSFGPDGRNGTDEDITNWSDD